MRLLPLALVLAGCASAPTAQRDHTAAYQATQLRTLISAAHSPLLCYTKMYGYSFAPRAASEELERRGHTCTTDDLTAGKADFERISALVEAQRHKEADERQRVQAARSAPSLFDVLMFIGAVGVLTQPRPAPPPPRPIQCHTSYTATGNANTVCQ